MAASWPQVGQYLDFRDRDNIWNVGLVIARNDSEIKVRSEGWAQKYDELIPISDDPTAIRNSRIQPFRSSIRGYTGTLKQPATREHWKFSNDDHDTRLKRVDDFLAQLQHKTCEELVQFLRG
jgi:hypothetical protein